MTTPQLPRSELRRWWEQQAVACEVTEPTLPTCVARTLTFLSKKAPLGGGAKWVVMQRAEGPSRANSPTRVGGIGSMICSFANGSLECRPYKGMYIRDVHKSFACTAHSGGRQRTLTDRKGRGP
jgi:hypothetical protein